MSRQPLRILRVITWLPLGGIEKRISMILPALKSRGHHVEVVCLREYGPLAERIKAQDIPVNLIPFKSRLDPVALRSLTGFLAEGKFDVIHSHMYRSNVPATVAARFSRVDSVVVAQIHNVDTWETKRQLMMDSFLCRWRDAVIGVSECVRQEILANLKISPEKCFVLYNGVDIAQYRDAIADPGLRQSLGIKSGDIIAVMVARLVPQKNHELVLRAAPDILEYVPSLKFMFVGDGKLRDELEHIAGELNIADRIIFTGNRDNVAHLLKISDFGLLVTFKEGFSNALVEAMAAGLPMIVSNAGGNPEAVIDGTNGFVISPDDIDVFKEKVILLAKDISLRNKMGKTSQDRAALFSIEAMVENTENLYYTLLERKQAK